MKVDQFGKTFFPAQRAPSLFELNKEKFELA